MDPLLREDGLAATMDESSGASAAATAGDDGFGLDGVPRPIDQDDRTSDDDAARPSWQVPTLVCIVVPTVAFLVGTFLAAALLPPSSIPSSSDSDGSHGPPSPTNSSQSQNNSDYFRPKPKPTNLDDARPPHREDAIAAAPTLLSIRDAGDGALLNVHNHPLYAQIKHASTFHYRAKTDFLTSITRQSAKTLAPDRYDVAHGEDLTLIWSPRERDVDDEDIIAMYCPSFVMDPKNFRDVATIAQARATSYQSRIREEREGAGEENSWFIPSFPFVREESCEFRLYSHSVDADDARDEGQGIRQQRAQHHHYTFLATTGPISLTSNKIPTGIHLGLTGEPCEVTVQFATGDSGEPLVEISKKSDVHGHGGRALLGEEAAMSMTKIKGTTTTYAAADMCQAPATSTDPGFFANPGYLHTVKVSGLEPGVEYVYRPGLSFGQGVKWSDEYSVLRGPPTRGSGPQGPGTPALTFLALSNQGCGESKYDIVAGADPPASSAAPSAPHNVTDLISSLVDAQTVDSVHHLGNLAYADGASHVWDAYADMIQSYASRVPVTVGVGNHEYDHSDGGGNGRDPSGVMSMMGFRPSWGLGGFDSTGGECGVPLSKRFAVPKGGNGVFWYSYDQSLAHTVMLSSEHNMTAGSRQYAWLEKDLAAVNRTATPWLVVEMHRPMYNSELVNWLNPMVSEGMQDEIEDLLYTYQVDLVLSGHYHSYFRSCAGLYSYRCEAGGPTYITVGAGGAPMDAAADAAIVLPNEYTEVFDGERFGVGRATVYNATAMHWEFMAVGGDVADEAWLIRDAPRGRHSLRG